MSLKKILKMPKAVPKNWAKQADIFTDEKSRRVFVCSECLKNIEHFRIVFFDYDISSLWRHIRVHHRTSQCELKITLTENETTKEHLEKNPKAEVFFNVNSGNEEDTDRGNQTKINMETTVLDQVSKYDPSLEPPETVQTDSQTAEVMDNFLINSRPEVEMEIFDSTPKICGSVINIESKSILDENRLCPIFLEELVNKETSHFKYEQRNQPSLKSTSESSNNTYIQYDKISSNGKSIESNLGDQYVGSDLTVGDINTYNAGTILPLENMTDKKSTVVEYSVTDALYKKHFSGKECVKKPGYSRNTDELPHKKIPSKLNDALSLPSSSDPLSTVTQFSPERPFQCIYCVKSFCQFWQLQFHYKLHVKKMKTSMKLLSVANPLQSGTSTTTFATDMQVQRDKKTHKHKLKKKTTPPTNNLHSAIQPLQRKKRGGKAVKDRRRLAYLYSIVKRELPPTRSQSCKIFAEIDEIRNRNPKFLKEKFPNKNSIK